MTDSESLESAAENLRKTVLELRDTVAKANDVKEELDALSRYGRRNRSMVTAVAIGFVLQAIVIGMMVFFGYRLEAVQEEQRNGALCPLYGIFIDADTPAAEERARQNGADIEQRREWFKIIHKSYDLLECSHDEAK